MTFQNDRIHRFIERHGLKVWLIKVSCRTGWQDEDSLYYTDKLHLVDCRRCARSFGWPKNQWGLKKDDRDAKDSGGSD